MKTIKVLLHFSAEDADKPIAWHFAHDYNLMFSIFQADVRSGRGGRMIMDISGEPEDIEKALEFARSENVAVNILSKAIVWNDDKCVHCGACTAVCIRRALHLDPVTAELSFNNAECVVCEMCINACPTGAIREDFI